MRLKVWNMLISLLSILYSPADGLQPEPFEAVTLVIRVVARSHRCWQSRSPAHSFPGALCDPGGKKQVSR
jgi:hypothetical protein